MVQTHHADGEEEILEVGMGSKLQGTRSRVRPRMRWENNARRWERNVEWSHISDLSGNRCEWRNCLPLT